VFLSIDELRQKFHEAKYIVDEVTLSQVYVAGELKKPVLIEGPPGCGKTELAKAPAFALDTVVEPQCEHLPVGAFLDGFGRVLPGDSPGLLQGAPLCLPANSVYGASVALTPLHWHNRPCRTVLFCTKTRG
jgi:hypothetical protein